MSIVLSIYSQKGFREVTLPERGQTELRILIRKELFDLSADVTLSLEKSGDVWELVPEGGVLHVDMTAKRYRRTVIKSGMRVEVELPGRKSITVLSAERKDPFTAYRKYGLAGLQQIRVGRAKNNDIQYQDASSNEQQFVSGDHCVLTLKNGNWELTDKSRNGTYVNFQRVYGSTMLRYGDSIRIMRLNIIFLGNMLAVNGVDGLHIMIPQIEGAERINGLASPGSGNGARKILFHRSPRNLRRLYTDPIEIEPPPQLQEPQQQSLAMQIGPSLTMAVPMILGSALSVVGNNSGSPVMMYTGIATALASALLAAFWALVSVRNAGKLQRQAENRRFESYSEYLIRMRDRIEALYKQNAQALRERSLSADECCGLDGASPLLWNRNEFYDDFLAVRLGMGDLPFQAPIEIPKERFTLIHDTLADKPRQLQENFRMLKDVPVSVDLRKERVVGI
ncbi:MAG: FHA domain-containing protein, partial [Oscillibacter sp.]|nr:FHA domain-containing protein [Oscillibacter sp.]